MVQNTKVIFKDLLGPFLAYDGKFHVTNHQQWPISYWHAKFEQNRSIKTKDTFKGRCSLWLAFDCSGHATNHQRWSMGYQEQNRSINTKITSKRYCGLCLAFDCKGHVTSHSGGPLATCTQSFNKILKSHTCARTNILSAFWTVLRRWAIVIEVLPSWAFSRASCTTWKRYKWKYTAKFYHDMISSQVEFIFLELASWVEIISPYKHGVGWGCTRRVYDS